MTYENIDPVLRHWAERHQLQLFTSYQDSDVRTVFVHGADNQRGQIWVDPPSRDGAIVIHAAVYRRAERSNQHSVASAERENLESLLEDAYAKVLDWLEESS